jgi:hypothetical protein
MTLIDARTWTEDDRQKVIIDFIRSKPYCNAEDVVQGVKNDISRVTVFKILHKLIESGAVKRFLENNQKRNAREHKLFVDEGNPLVSVRLELEKFESAYFDLLNRAMMEFEPERIRAALKSVDDVPVSYKSNSEVSRLVKQFLDEHKSNPKVSRLVKQVVDTSYKLGYRHGQLTKYLLDIFYSMIDAYLFRFLFVWSQKISDQQVLQQLYSMVFSQIADMQKRLSESQFLKPPLRDTNMQPMEQFIRERFRGSEGSGPLLQYLDSFKKVGMEKEIEPVIDSLWKIIGDLQPYVYPEPRKYSWPFKYGEDGWRKLKRLLKEHPESSPYNTDKS